jgi:hypothetical protein
VHGKTTEGGEINSFAQFFIRNGLYSELYKDRNLSSVVLGFSLVRKLRSPVPATLTQHLCQRSFYKIFVKFRNSKKKVLKLKIILIIVDINKDENKSLISNQFSLKNDL